MNREQVLEFLLKELEKVPNRDVCRVATEEQMERIAAELDFETILEIWLVEDLKLYISEIPEELRTEVIVYFCLLTEYEYADLNEKEIWSYYDEETLAFLTNIEEVFWLVRAGHCDHVLDIRVADFLEYAKSDKPDF